MLLNLHRDVRVQRLAIGAEQAPLLVIDQLVADPERLVRKAASNHFAPQGAMFPGVRARAPLAYEQFIATALKPLLTQAFGLPEGRFAFPMCHYSLVALDPARLEFLQRVPHIDSTDGHGLATVHYLFRGEWGGTGFYRHRRTGFEVVDESRREHYFSVLDEERRGCDAPQPRYIDGDTPLFEQVAKVDGVFNRMVVYRRNSLHSGNIDSTRVPPPDPMTGRLSINSFIDVVR